MGRNTRKWKVGQMGKEETFAGGMIIYPDISQEFQRKKNFVEIINKFKVICYKKNIKIH